MIESLYWLVSNLRILTCVLKEYERSWERRGRNRIKRRLGPSVHHVIHKVGGFGHESRPLDLQVGWALSTTTTDWDPIKYLLKVYGGENRMLDAARLKRRYLCCYVMIAIAIST